MPFPVAHGIVGASIVAASRPISASREDCKALLVGALLAICPDFDFFLVWFLGLGDNWHRSFSHSLAFALIVGLLAAALSKAPSSKEAAAYVLAVLSHGLLDLLTTKRTGGVELFWPFSPRRLKFVLFDYPDVHLSQKIHPVAEFLLDLLKFSVIELIIFAPLLVTLLLVNRLRSRAIES